MRISDWSSDVCSSDLSLPFLPGASTQRWSGKKLAAEAAPTRAGERRLDDSAHRRPAQTQAVLAAGLVVPGDGFVIAVEGVVHARLKRPVRIEGVRHTQVDGPVAAQADRKRGGGGKSGTIGLELGGGGVD